MFYSESILKDVIMDPISSGADHLYIVTAYATPNMASWALKSIPQFIKQGVEISIIVGMTPYDGLSVAVHNGFKDLVSEFPTFHCSYICNGPPIHLNLYAWTKNGVPIEAFTGTVCFVQSCFLGHQIEYMRRVNPKKCLDFIKSIESNTIYCNHNEVEEAIIIKAAHPVLDNENLPLAPLSGAGLQKVTLSLLTKKGSVGQRSGLNWGQRKGREKNQAYIPLPAEIARTGFFPPKDQHFTAITDDHKQLTLRVEQQNDKAITTPMRNADLGEYFRNRLGIANGESVAMEDLLRYGRTDVTFYKLDDEQYYMDFSI